MRQGLGLILLGLFSLLCHAADPAVEQATDWLLTQARDDGAIYNTSTIATPFQATAEVSRLDGVAPVAAREFLLQHPFRGTEYLARRWRLGLGDITQLEATLRERQNPDGGFGDLPGYQSSVLDTARVLPLLDPQAPVAVAALAFLLAEQRSDGGWADGPNASGVYTTALALEALQPFRAQVPVAAARQSAAALLHQQLEGGLSTHLQALALRALLPLETIATLADEVAELRAAQQGDGSWEGDVYTTALAAQVLTLSLQSPLNPDYAVLQGRLVSATSGWPLVGATVQLQGAVELSASSNADGEFRFPALDAGAYQLTISGPGHQTLHSSLELNGAENRNLGTVLLARDANTESITVFGTVRDRQRNPLAGVLIRAGSVQVLSDEDGQYWLTGLEAGAVDVEAVLAGHHIATTQFQLVAGSYSLFSPVLYELEDSPQGNWTVIIGKVVDALSGEPIEGVSVTMDRISSIKTAEDGGFNLFTSGNVAGEVSSTFSKVGYEPWEMNVWLNGGQRNDLGVIRMTPEIPLLPDLVSYAMDTTSVSTDPASFRIQGNLQVEVINTGVEPSIATHLRVFADTNADGIHDGSEPWLGQTPVTGLNPSESTVLQVPLDGEGVYRDPPLAAVVDSQGLVLEKREDNNTRSSLDHCGVEDAGVKPLQAVEKWRWSGGSATTTPMVAPLQDTNGDGLLSAEDTPAILLITHSGWPDGATGTLVALDGSTGLPRWTLDSPGFRPLSQLAIGDIDGDGFPEIVAHRYPTGTVIISGEGQILQESPLPDYQVANNSGGYSLADLDGDGIGEILYTRLVMNADGSARWLGTGSAHGSGVNVVADLNHDGSPEVIVGNSLYSAAGDLLWEQFAVSDGRTAVAELDGDRELEIILAGKTADGRGALHALKADGSLLWGPVRVSTGRFGAPTVGDVDGDGQVEIGVASQDHYTLLRSDGSPLWQRRIEDLSGFTAASFFDLDDDGTQEIIHADSYSLRVFDGATGEVRQQLANASYTGAESPVVADVDGDGQAEIVLTSADTAHTVRVLENLNDDWPATRAIYNQSSYHPGGISDAAALAPVAGQGWERVNGFRVNPRGMLSGLVDWTLGGLKVLQQHDGSTAIVARVANAGGAGGIARVRFFQTEVDGERLLGEETVSLLPGQYQDLTLRGVHVRGEGLLRAEVRDAQDSPECRDDNNQINAPLEGGGVGELQLASSFQTVAAEPLNLSAQIHNSGSLVQSYTLRWQLEDLAGELVVGFAEQSIASLQGGATVTVEEVLDRQNLLAGEYRFVGVLLSANGVELQRQTLPLVILGDGVAPEILLLADHTEYAPEEAIALNLTLRNASFNESLVAGDVTINVIDQQGQTLITHLIAAPALAPGHYQWLAPQLFPLDRWAAGTYQVQVEWQSGSQMVSAQTGFQVSANPLNTLLAGVTVASTLVSSEDSQHCDYAVENPSPNSEFRVGLRELQGGEPDHWITLQAPADGSRLSHQEVIPVAQLALGDWVCEIQVHSHGDWWSLAYGGFSLDAHGGGSGAYVGDPLPLFPDQNYPDGYRPGDMGNDEDDTDHEDHEDPMNGDVDAQSVPVAVPLGGTMEWLLLMGILLLLAQQGVTRPRR